MIDENFHYFSEATDSLLAQCWWQANCLPSALCKETVKESINTSFWPHVHWASSTGLTAVSKFKPRLPAQWAVGTHRIGPSRMEKVTSRMNWPIRNSTQIRIRIELVGNTIMWNPSLFFISNRFYKTQNNFGPLNDHIITEFSWVVTMTPAVPSTDILRWPVTSQLSSTRRLKLWRICYIS